MKFKLKPVWSAMALGVAALPFHGCGGFSGSQSISPATFLLPGLVESPVKADKTPGVPSQSALAATNFFANFR